MSIKDLDEIARRTLYGAGPSAVMVRHTFSVFAPYIRGRSLLEVGAAEGIMTELLSRTGLDLTIVEGAETFCDDLRRRFPDATVVHSLIEDVEIEGPFDTVVLGHVLEHVDDPIAALATVRRLLAPGGRILCAVPNARSLHRQMAVIMGLTASEADLSDLDIQHGHRRVYDPESFRQEFLQAGLRIERFGGYWMKPISNAQIEQAWSPEMLEAAMALGERYPDISAEIYVIATDPDAEQD